MAIRVGDLFLGLGVVPDLNGFKAGDTAIDRTVAKLSKLGQMAKQVQHDLERTSKNGIVPVGQLGKTRESRARDRDNLESSKLLLRLGRDNEAAEARLARLRQRNADKAAAESKAKREKDISEAKTAVGGLLDKLAIALAAAATAAAYGIYSTVRSVLLLAGHLDDVSHKTGLATDALQKWHYATKLGGAEAETFDKGLVILSKNLNIAAKTGQGPAVDAFAALGISMSDPAVKSRDLNKILFLVSNKFSTMPDGAKKAAVAMGLFGKSGADLIPTLNEGVAGISAQGAELEKLGGVIDSDAVKKMAGLDDQFDKMGVAIQGIKQRMVTALLPVIEKLSTAFLNWIVQNKELLAQRMAEFAEALGSALSTLGRVVAFAVKHWTVFRDLLITGGIVAGIYKIAQAIIFFQKILKLAAVQAAIEWVIMLGPIAWVAAAIIALGALVYVFRDEIWDALKAVGRFFEEVGISIRNGWNNTWDWVKRQAKAAWEYVASLDWARAIPVIGWLGEKLGHAAGAVVNGVTGARHLDDVDTIINGDGSVTGATGPTRVSPATRTGAPAAGGSASVTNSYSIQIDAKNADAREVAQLVDDKIKEHDERTRRDTGAALGVVGVS